MKTSKEGKPKRVSFSFSAPRAGKVSVAGDFNEWNPMSHPMKKDKKGVWKVSLNLVSGTYQYRFFVDGEWRNDPDCTENIENQFGSFNCVKKVG